ncbi:hypothetical protein [Cupriavidus taiwanensis]|nr:hypothetical protein [Cupriavidus taiwanensis]
MQLLQHPIAHRDCHGTHVNLARRRTGAGTTARAVARVPVRQPALRPA